MLHPRAPSWLILLLSSTIFFFLFVQFAKSISYRDPGSRFFDPERAYEQSYSLIRSAEAAQFQADVQAWLESEPETRGHETPAALTKVGDNPQMCVQFITTARAVGTQYLDVRLPSFNSKPS